MIFVIGTRSRKIRGRSRIIKATEKAADLRAAATGIVTSALTEYGYFGYARGAAMGNDLNHSSDGVGAVDRAFGATNDFDFVYVVEREVGKIHGVAGFVDRRSVNQHFGVAGIPAVQKNGSATAFRPSPANRNSRHIQKRVRKTYRLTRIDVGPRQHR